MSKVKRAVIGYCIAFGNMFLAHGLFFVSLALIIFFHPSEEIPVVILVYALQLAANIALYFTVLKKMFKPPEKKTPPLYFLLAITAAAVWVIAFNIFLLLYDVIGVDIMNSYPEALLGFLPLFLIFTVLFSVIYYTLFRKRVGELFCFYTVGIMLAVTIPAVLVLLVPGT